MDFIFSITGFVQFAVLGVSIAVKVYAFVTALGFSERAYEAGAKLSKVAWCLILGLAVLAQVIDYNALSLLNIVGMVAASVFLVDVRPTLRRFGRG